MSPIDPHFQGSGTTEVRLVLTMSGFSHSRLFGAGWACLKSRTPRPSAAPARYGCAPSARPGSCWPRWRRRRVPANLAQIEAPRGALREPRQHFRTLASPKNSLPAGRPSQASPRKILRPRSPRLRSPRRTASSPSRRRPSRQTPVARPVACDGQGRKACDGANQPGKRAGLMQGDGS